MEFKAILFDCMETLIDVAGASMPLRDYALWAYEGSGLEIFWDGYEDFYRDYKAARDLIAEKLPQHKEYEILERFKQAVRFKFGSGGESRVEEMSAALYKNFWENYKSKVYVEKDVRDVLPKLAERSRLGVVSNFMVKNGIEELLELTGLKRYFDFAITSINEGWRKPHPAIFTAAVEKTGVRPDEIVMFGDDLVNDYHGGRNAGIKTVLLDRYGKQDAIKERVRDFYEFEDLLSKGIQE